MSIPDKLTAKASAATNNVVMLMTNPYSDYNLTATGYPDGTAIMSAVQRKYARTTIQNPFTLAAGETWGFHIFATPLHFATDLIPATVSNNSFVYSSSPAPLRLGPLNVTYFRYTAMGNVAEHNTQCLGQIRSSNNTNEAQIRTVSFGYELHNTTAELTKSGSLTVYRAPSNYHDIHGYIQVTPAGTTSPFSAAYINQTPASLDKATNYPNTRTFEAKEGVYSVCLPHPHNTFSPSIKSNIVLGSGHSDIAAAIAYTGIDTGPTVSHSPLSCTGVFSSRYSTEQTFILDYRQVLEILPSPTDLVDLSYASTCPDLDPIALKIYKRMHNKIPPGVPVGQNASGDWARTLVNIAKSILPGIAAIPGPIGRIAAIASPIVGVVDRAINPTVDSYNRMITTQAPLKPSNAIARRAMKPRNTNLQSLIKKRLAANMKKRKHSKQ